MKTLGEDVYKRQIQTIVLGNILAIDPADILQLTIIGILSIIVL